MRKTLLLAISFVIFFVSCKKVVTNTLDKQVTLYFPISYWSTNTTDFASLPAHSFLTDFDKRDYPGVDSVILVAGLSLDDPSDTVYVRLFNVTDNQEIQNSQISTTNVAIDNYNELQTQDIFNSLPDKRVTLAVQIRSAKGNSYVYVQEPYLKLRRD